MQKLILTSGLVSAILLSACDHDTKQDLGLIKAAPDEFAVVTRAPLSVPPEYTLRPPVPGKQRPMEISTQDAARQTVFGVKDVDNSGIARPDSVSDNGFFDKVGVNDADPSIRDVVDAETAQGVEDTRPTAEKLMFWQSKPEEQGTPLDPKEEYQRLQEQGVTTIKKRNEDIEAP